MELFRTVWGILGFGFRGLEFRALLRVSGFHPKPYKDSGLGAWFRDLEKWSRAFRFGRGFIPGYAESCYEMDLGVGFSILFFGLCFQDWSVVLWGLNVRIPRQGDANHGLKADSRISQQQDAGSNWVSKDPYSCLSLGYGPP